MDGITLAICDSCTPMITPIVTLASIEEKVVIVVNIMPGGRRPYYLTAKGKEKRNLYSSVRNHQTGGFVCAERA